MIETRRQARPSWTIALVVVAALSIGLSFTALGVWQVQRLQWKLALIERVEQRLASEPSAPPGREEWSGITAESAEYRRIRLQGQYQHDKETLVQAATALGSGFWVLTPFVTDQGFVVLVNRGFVDPAHKSPATRNATAPANTVSVTGFLRPTEPKGPFLRANDPANDRWFSRDVAAIAFARGLSDTAPYFVDADASPNAGDWPVGGMTRVRFSNNHLVYAATWFTLAMMAFAGAGYVLYDARRAR